MDQNSCKSTIAAQQTDNQAIKERLSARAHILCGWPLLLVAIGGAVGGGLGGVAYIINLAIYKSKMPVLAKIILNIITGLSAVGVWSSITIAMSRMVYGS